MESEFCFNVAGYIKQMRKFDELDADRRDTVGAVLEMTFVMEGGEAVTQRAELRQGDKVVPVALRESVGSQGTLVRSNNLVDMLRQRAGDVEDDGQAIQMCVVDPAREGRLWTDPGYDLKAGFAVRFLDTPGTHTLASLEKGGKDGRKHWKKMAGAMGFMVPKFDHVAVANDDAVNPPKVTALRGGEAIGDVPGEFYDGARMIDLDTLEDMGADALRVETATYRLTPSPDAKTVARFTGGGNKGEKGDDKD